MNSRVFHPLYQILATDSFYFCTTKVLDAHGSFNSGQIGEMYLPSAGRNENVLYGTEKQMHLYGDQKFYKQQRQYQREWCLGLRFCVMWLCASFGEWLQAFLKGRDDPRIWKHYGPFETSRNTQRHSITSQKAWIMSSTAVRTLNLISTNTGHTQKNGAV